MAAGDRYVHYCVAAGMCTIAWQQVCALLRGSRYVHYCVAAGNRYVGLPPCTYDGFRFLICAGRGSMSAFDKLSTCFSHKSSCVFVH